MFRIDPHHTYKWTVTVHKPVGKTEARPDGFEAVELHVTFKALPTSQIEAFVDDRELLRAAWVGADVADPDGVVLEWTDELRDKLIDIPYVRPAVAVAYMQSVHGAKEKNSPTSPAGGRAAAPAAPAPRTLN
jgi:hypothetical protein